MYNSLNYLKEELLLRTESADLFFVFYEVFLHYTKSKVFLIGNVSSTELSRTHSSLGIILANEICIISLLNEDFFNLCVGKIHTYAKIVY